MNIAICDIDKEFASIIKLKIEEKLGSVDVDIYTDSKLLMQSDKVYDCVFLYMDMPDINGIDMARCIREKYTFTKMIFILSKLDAVVEVKGKDVNLLVGDFSIKLPAEKAKKLIDGGYAGKTVVMGIRPENVSDSPEFIKSSPDTVIESTIRVYELLGAEVFLYFDFEGCSMTARVDPRTTARTGDTVKFALDAEKIHVFDKETELVITN